MPKLLTLSGDDVLRVLRRFGFAKFSQRGSHVKLRRATPDGSRQTLTIVTHREIDKERSSQYTAKHCATFLKLS